MKKILLYSLTALVVVTITSPVLAQNRFSGLYTLFGQTPQQEESPKPDYKKAQESGFFYHYCDEKNGLCKFFYSKEDWENSPEYKAQEKRIKQDSEKAKKDFEAQQKKMIEQRTKEMRRKIETMLKNMPVMNSLVFVEPAVSSYCPHGYPNCGCGGARVSGCVYEDRQRVLYIIGIENVNVGKRSIPSLLITPLGQRKTSSNPKEQ